MLAKFRAAAATAALLSAFSPALADEPAPAAAPAPPVLSPAFSGPLANNPNPTHFDIGGLGTIYVTGVASGIGQVQSNRLPGDDDFADIANAQVFIQKADGVFQFLVQAGYYSFPTLDLPYIKASTNTDSSYGPVPQAWIKIAPSASFNIQAGILPSMFGAEGAYTYQNMNIDRGMLWAQENVFAHGVQANFTSGKLTLSGSVNDGFFSGKWNWVSGSATYVINPANTIAIVAGGATSKNYKSTFATPTAFNNSQIYNVIYTYSNGPLMVQPYFQYTHIPTLTYTVPDGEGGTSFVTAGKANTYSGAILARYNFTPNFSIPIRLEYIDTQGDAASNAPNLLNGPGSNAFSFTITPTYTWKALFARAEFNVVSASSITPGFGFGNSGVAKSQSRGLVEVGVIF